MTLSIFQCPICSLKYVHLQWGAQISLSPIYRGILKSFLRLFSRMPQPKEIQRGICGPKKSSFYSCQDLDTPSLSNIPKDLMFVLVFPNLERMEM